MTHPQKLPAGWDEAGLRDLISHYNAQTEDEQAAEIEEALASSGVTMVAVPLEIADEVRALIARRLSA
jgi:5'-deoxynucleotidase YfbR-like HD superfamily hydrolase